MNVITDIKSKWDKGNRDGFNKHSLPHNVTGVLKLYLKEMPEPLMTFSRYDAFLRLGGEKDANTKLRETKKLLEGLPRTNYATLRELLRLLNKIAACSATNNMRAANLSMVFASNVFRPEVETIEYIVQDTPLINSEFEFIIENYPALFNDPSGQTLSNSVAPPPQPQPTAAVVAPSDNNNDDNDALKMMSDNFNMEEWANMGNDMLAAPEMAAAATATTVPGTTAGDEGEGVMVEEEEHDEVWDFRAQSYTIIENIYELTNVITECLPGVRCVSELVFVASLLLEAHKGTECPTEEALQAPTDIALQAVRSPDTRRLLALLDRYGEALFMVTDAIGSYVEELADVMSRTEELEPLYPMDARFRWIEAVLSRTKEAFDEPGGLVPDATAEDAEVDASVLRNVPGLPPNVEEGIVLCPPKMHQKQQQQQQQHQPTVAITTTTTAVPSIPALPPPPPPPVEDDIPPPLGAVPTKTAAPAPPPPPVEDDIPPPLGAVPAKTVGSAQPSVPPQAGPQVKVQTTTTTTATVATAPSNIAKKQQQLQQTVMRAPQAHAPVAVGVNAGVATPLVKTVMVKTAPTAQATVAVQMGKAPQKEEASVAMEVTTATVTGSGEAKTGTVKTAKTPAKKAPAKAKVEGQRCKKINYITIYIHTHRHHFFFTTIIVDGSMLAEPTGKIIEVLQLIQNDLRTIDPQSARGVCTMLSNIKIVTQKI